jgi:hypothetical protein
LNIEHFSSKESNDQYSLCNVQFSIKKPPSQAACEKQLVFA